MVVTPSLVSLLLCPPEFWGKLRKLRKPSAQRARLGNCRCAAETAPCVSTLPAAADSAGHLRPPARRWTEQSLSYLPKVQNCGLAMQFSQCGAIRKQRMKKKCSRFEIGALWFRAERRRQRHVAMQKNCRPCATCEPKVNRPDAICSAKICRCSAYFPPSSRHRSTYPHKNDNTFAEVAASTFCRI